MRKQLYQSKLILVKLKDGDDRHCMFDDLLSPRGVKTKNRMIKYTTNLFLGHELAHAIREITGRELPDNTGEERYIDETETWRLTKTFVKPKYWNNEEAQKPLDEYYLTYGLSCKRAIVSEMPETQKGGEEDESSKF